MNYFMLITLLLLMVACSTPIKSNVTDNNTNNKQHSTLRKQTWNHGSADCKNNIDATFDVYEHSVTSFIIRQNKCLTFEAPFIYILVGKQKILVVDSGALSDNPEFSLYTELEKILSKTQLAVKQVLVVHTHGHSDHYQGDGYFEGRSNVTVVNTSTTAVRQFFDFSDWPHGQASIDLGERKLTIIPTPGHQEESITLYDHQTQWLITGDTLYPGYIYVKDWQAYRNSINRLATFSSKHTVSAIMGAHIEKTSLAATFFPIGSTYQPNEATLDLPVHSLTILNTRLQKTDEAIEINFDDFVIRPMNSLQKTLSNMARWLLQ